MTTQTTATAWETRQYHVAGMGTLTAAEIVNAGFDHTGFRTVPSLGERPRPTFEGLNGPMSDGPDGLDAYYELPS